MAKILFTGDTQLKGMLSEDIEKLINQHDYFIYNNEVAVTESNTETEKMWKLKTSPNEISIFKNIKTKIIGNIANNHIYDYGNDGFIDTLNYLKNFNIDIIGKKDECSSYDDFSLFAASQYGNAPYINYMFNRDEFISKINELSKIHKKLIVNLHLGYEYSLKPAKEDILFLRALIDNGAYLIVCHHPHVIQGFEKYNNGYIFYSLGNFDFEIKENSFTNTDISLMLSFDTEKNSFQLYPIKIKNNFTMQHENSEIVLRNIQKLNKFDIGFKYDFNFYRKISRVYLFDNFKSWFFRIRKYGFAHLLQFFKAILSKQYIKMYIGYIFGGFAYYQKSLDCVNFNA